MAHDILIVDDEADIRMLIAGVLKDEGYETRASADGEGALAAVRTRPPSLVILDIWLQGSTIDGIEALEIMLRENPLMPVVMISGHGTIETAVTAIKRGAYSSRSHSSRTGCCWWSSAPSNRRASSARIRI
jgi:two-component system nitrogen regulation response regulator NtrX